MFDVANTANLIQQLASVNLEELRSLHGRIVDAEEMVRALIRRREAQERRDARLRERGLSIAGAIG